MARISTTALIVRREPGERDRARDYRILVDGKTVGSIGEDEQITLPISDGPHTLRLKLDITYSNERSFTAKPGAHLNFVCRSGSLSRVIIDGLFHRHNYILLSSAEDLPAAGTQGPLSSSRRVVLYFLAGIVGAVTAAAVMAAAGLGAMASGIASAVIILVTALLAVKPPSGSARN